MPLGPGGLPALNVLEVAQAATATSSQTEYLVLPDASFSLQ